MSHIQESLLIAVVSFVLLVGCWNAPFLGYDDREHVLDNPQVQVPLTADRLMTITSNYPFYPVTILSYKLDLVIFDGIGRAMGSIAPAMRFETLIVHIVSALLLRQILIYFGLGQFQALFISLVFAMHPMACETVSWISERKNALAAMFGFAALWAWLRWEDRLWRVPAASVLYFLAVMSKPSALGLLPVYILFELFGGRAGFTAIDPPLILPPRKLLARAVRLTPLVLVALFDFALNIEGHAKVLKELIPPPGGSLFTAALTDLEILSRYLFSLLAPVNLSILYYVKPVASLGDPRVYLYGAILLAAFAVTMFLAENRRRALFGWLWFVAAAGPNLNFVATYDLMQDRYVYLSLPGLFMVVVETAAGIALYKPKLNYFIPRAAVAYMAILFALAGARSTIWASTLPLFSDAIEKQPNSSLSHCLLATAYKQAWAGASRIPDQAAAAEEFFKKSNEHLRIAVEECPDADRNPLFAMMALLVGEEYNRVGNLRRAQRAWLSAAYPPAKHLDQPNVRALALGYLASLDLATGHPEEAYKKASDAVLARCEPPSRLIHARAALGLAAAIQKTDPERAHWALEIARAELVMLLPNEHFKGSAIELLDSPLLNAK